VKTRCFLRKEKRIDAHIYFVHFPEEEEINKRARRAAAAARRWREYSRRGVDKPPTFKLPEAASNSENTK